MNASTKNLLRNIVEKFGTDLAKSPRLCDAYLSDLMPAYPEERNLLVNAVAAGVTDELRLNNTLDNQKVLASRFAKTYFVSEAEALAVIDTWAFALQSKHKRTFPTKDKYVARHYLAGVLTGLIVLGVGSAIAVYQRPNAIWQLVSTHSFYDSAESELVKVASPEVKPVLSVESQMPDVMAGESIESSAVNALINSVSPAQSVPASSATPVSQDQSLTDGVGDVIEEQYISGALPSMHKDFPYATDNTIDVQDYNRPLGASARQQQQAEIAAMKKAEADWLSNEAQRVALEKAATAQQARKAAEAKAVHKASVQQARKEAAAVQQARKAATAKQDLDRKRAKAEAVALKKAKAESKRKQLALAVQQKKKFELQRKQAADALQARKALLARQQAEALARKKAEQALAPQQQIKANQARQQQAVAAHKKNVMQVQNIARQLMGSSIAFGQTSVLLNKKQGDLGVLKNLLKLTQEAFYLQQQREVNNKIDELRKKQNALSAGYMQHLRQLCSLPAASVQSGVHLLSPAYSGKQGVKVVAFRMLKQHTARCSQVKRIQNDILTRELSLAYRQILTNP